MKRAILLAIVCVLVSSFTPGAWAISVGEKPELSVKLSNGRNLSLADLRGKIVLLDFWATWCPPCMAQAPHMVAINKQYEPKGLQIVGISLDRDGGAMARVVQQKGFSWPQYLDLGGRVSDQWGVTGIPRVFLLDPEGTVVWDGHPAQMDAAIEDAFAKTPPVLVDPKISAEAGNILDQVETLMSGGDEASALKTMTTMPGDARKDPAIDERSAAIEAQLQSIGQAMMQEVEPLLEQKKYMEAAARLNDVVKGLPSLPLAKQANQRLAELKAMPEVKAQIELAEKQAQAAAELVAAKQLQSDAKDEEAFAKFKSIVKQFVGTDAATEAQEAIKKYEQDPAFVKRATESAASGKAKGLISLAQSYRSAGKTDLARKKYQEIIDEFPGTSYADTAQKELESLN